MRVMSKTRTHVASKVAGSPRLLVLNSEAAQGWAGLGFDDGTLALLSPVLTLSLLFELIPDFTFCFLLRQESEFKERLWLLE